MQALAIISLMTPLLQSTTRSTEDIVEVDMDVNTSGIETQH